MENTRVIVGAQWGDEGKGKMTDYLARTADIIVRFQGGNNAGHTIEALGKKYKLQLIPSGIVYGNRLNIIGNGVAFNPFAFIKEKEYLESMGINISRESLRISDRVNLIMPYHIELDRLKEIKRGAKNIGTTGKGIGPCYTDKYDRSGIRMCDLMDGDSFTEKLKVNLEEKNEYIVKVLSGQALDFNEINKDYLAIRDLIKDYVCDTSVLLDEAIRANKKVLFEGAQGMLLDIDYGSYPYVTSSSTTAGGVSFGTGIGPTKIHEVFGVTKAYTTRVGKGPFPTELEDERGNFLRERGQEYGTVTGRARRCGWLDLVIVKTAARVSGLTALMVTKLDTLRGLDTLKVCIGYELDGRVIDYFPASLKDLQRCKPVYRELKGWHGDISKVKNYLDLPKETKDYIQLIEEVTKVKVTILSVGPNREETIEI